MRYNMSYADIKRMRGSVLTRLLLCVFMAICVCDARAENYVVFNNDSSQVPYRIPAIGCTINGDVIAVADYRYSHADIGVVENGKLDLKFRIKDHETGEWGRERVLAASRGEGAANVAFGDPCIVADSESERVLVTSCCGNVSFPSGTHAHHQGWARFYSEDGGKSWSEYVDISDQVFKQLDKRNDGEIRCFFIGSGKISQSRKIKTGKYYRLYCAALVKLNGGENVNYVFYSDDFGEEWKLLGEVEDCPIPGGADEAKAEELPDGSVIVSSRISGGRYYNVYHYTDVATGKGTWGEVATSDISVGGVKASTNPCNGEIMIVPVKATSTDEKAHLLLQSVPLGPKGRKEVGINYKVLESADDYRTASEISKDWDGVYRVSTTSSAYSTMTLDKENNVAFLYEESQYNSGYNIVYRSLSISEITGGEYVYDAP